MKPLIRELQQKPLKQEYKYCIHCGEDMGRSYSKGIMCDACYVAGKYEKRIEEIEKDNKNAHSILYELCLSLEAKQHRIKFCNELLRRQPLKEWWEKNK